MSRAFTMALIVNLVPLLFSAALVSSDQSKVPLKSFKVSFKTKLETLPFFLLFWSTKLVISYILILHLLYVVFFFDKVSETVCLSCIFNLDRSVKMWYTIALIFISNRDLIIPCSETTKSRYKVLQIYLAFIYGFIKYKFNSNKQILTITFILWKRWNHHFHQMIQRIKLAITRHTKRK